MLKCVVYMSYVMAVILYGSEVWSLRRNDIEILG